MQNGTKLFDSPVFNRFGYLAASTAFLYIFISLVIYAVPSLQAWHWLAFAPVRQVAMLSPPFADAAMLTHSSTCADRLSDLYDGSLNCDPYRRLFTYPPVALWMFRILGLSAASLGWVGLIVGTAAALVTGAFFFVLIPSAGMAGVLLALAYLSLPFQLVLERGNNDLIVFLLMALLALALASEKRGSASAALLLSFLAVATKILPLFGIAAMILVQPGGPPSSTQRRNLRWALLGGVAGLGLVLPWIGPILRNSPSPSGHLLSHGLMAHEICYEWITTFKLSGIHSRVLAYACPGTKQLFILAGLIGASRLGLHGDLLNFLTSGTSRLRSRLVAVSLCLFTGTWVGTYLFTRSYDYKFIFLLPALGLTGAVLAGSATDGSRRLAWISLVLAPLLLAWFLPYLSISFNQPLGSSLELLNDFVMIPVLMGALLGLLIPGPWDQ